MWTSIINSMNTITIIINCYTITINHFVKKVYYELAEKIIGIINESGSNLKVTGHIDLLFKSFKQKLRLLKKKIFSK